MTQTNTTQNKEELEQELEKSLNSLRTTNSGAVVFQLHQHKHIEFMGGAKVEDLIPALKELFRNALSQAHQSGIEEGARKEREKIKWAWTKLNIVAGASAGSAQGLIARNPWGETDAMQVDREAYKEFIESLKENKQ